MSSQKYWSKVYILQIKIKITKIKWICIFLTNSGQKSLAMFISSCFNNYLIEFLKIGKLQK